MVFHCRHLSRRHEDKYKQYLREIERPQAGPTQPVITDFASSPSTSGSRQTYSHTSTRAKQLSHSVMENLIVACGLPVSLVDHPNFRKCMLDFDPKYAPPCRQTVTYTLIPKAVEAKKTELRDKLDRSLSVALTSDVWTDRRMHSYLGITVHSFVGGVPESNLLAFKALRGSHTGQRIAEEMDRAVTYFGLKDKIRVVVTDNASNMLKAMCIFFPTPDEGSGQETESHVDDISLWEDLSSDDLEAALSFSETGARIACFCHSLQLVVRAGLEKSSAVLRPAMGKVSKLANVVHQSQLFRAAFEEKFGVGKSIPSTTDTRWNSMYRQLQTVVDIDQTKLAELLRSTSHENLVLTSKELAVVQEIVDILHPFAEATDITQGDQVVTISVVVPTVLSLRRFLLSMADKVKYHGVTVKEFITQMHERFFHLFARLDVRLPHSQTARTLAFDSDVFLMASALDPRFAFHWLQDHPGSQEVKDGLRHRITGRVAFVS